MVCPKGRSQTPSSTKAACGKHAMEEQQTTGCHCIWRGCKDSFLVLPDVMYHPNETHANIYSVVIQYACLGLWELRN